MKKLFCCIALLFAFSPAKTQTLIERRGASGSTKEDLTSTREMAERLKHPELITLRLLSYSGNSSEQPTDTPSPFAKDSKPELRLVIRHTYPERLIFWESIDPYYDVRPRLLRAGELIPYSKRAQKNVDSVEGRPSVGSSAPTILEPERDYAWAHFNFDQWYGPLKAGRYQITIQLRFAWDVDWTESSPVFFEIRP